MRYTVLLNMQPWLPRWWRITHNSAERKGGRGGTDGAVSVIQACKSPVVWSQRIKHVFAPPIPLGNLGW